MRFMTITSLLIGSVAAFPATSYLKRTNADAGWMPGFTDAAATSRYVTSPVKAEEVVKTVMAIGSLIPSVNVEVGSVLSGQISKLAVDFNDKVVKGQVLAELDDRTYALAADAGRAAVEGAKFEIGSFEARLKKAILDLWQAEHQLPVFTARVDYAKVQLEMADRDYKRKLWLQERETATVTDVQNMQAKRDSLAATLRETETNLANQTGLIASARADLDRARADLAAAQAAEVRLESQWQSAMVDLERTKLRAPIDGVILGRTVTEGQTLATGLEAKTLFIIAGDLENMEINARIDESDIISIKQGQPATFTVDAFPGRTFNAIVKQIRMSPQIVSNVVTYTVVLKTPNPDGALLPGMTVLASIVTRRSPVSPTVPMAALRYKPKAFAAAARTDKDKSTDSLWVLRDGAPTPLSVVRGDADGTSVAVISGDLRPDDMVIIRDNGQRSPVREN